MSVRFVIGDLFIKWMAQAPFVHIPRFGDPYIKWVIQAPDIAD